MVSVNSKTYTRIVIKIAKSPKEKEKIQKLSSLVGSERIITLILREKSMKAT